jgi:hypothetical protein
MAWFISKIFYTTKYFPYFGGGEKKKTVNLLPDHPLPNTKHHTIYLFNFPLVTSRKPFLLTLSTLPTFHKSHKLVGPYCPHLHPTESKPLQNNEYKFSPHTTNTLPYFSIDNAHPKLFIDIPFDA